MTMAGTQAHEGGTGRFGQLRVVAKTVESSLITSFLLEAADGSALPAFRPGQFLVLKVPVPNGTGHVLRNYSLSGSPDVLARYRISVKREGAPDPDVPAGLVSAHLHDSVAVGDVIAAEGPRGAFVLDETSGRPVVLLSGGVGLTPMVAMLHRLAAGSMRRCLFVHACENGAVHALREEVEALVAQRPGLTAHFCYRSPTEADRASRRYDTEGVIDKALLQQLLCLDDYDVYLCGPPPFMKAVYGTLRDLGVARDRIAYEFFGPATVLDAEAAKPEAQVQVPAQVPAQARPVVALTGAVSVEFTKSGGRADWKPDSHSLLDLAEAQGLKPEFSCRAGICGTCVTRITSGEVEYFEEPLEELAPGEVLLCCSRPTTDVVLEL